MSSRLERIDRLLTTSVTSSAPQAGVSSIAVWVASYRMQGISIADKDIVAAFQAARR